MVTATVTGMTRPATSEMVQSRRKRKRTMQARMRPMRMASRTLAMDFADEFGLIVERDEMNAGGKFGLQCDDLIRDGVGDLNGVGRGLAGDIE